MAASSSQTEQVYRRIRAKIVEGSLAPGTRIVEREIAKRLGVSRTPVRQAVKRLEQEGFIRTNTATKYARPVVAALTSEDARELYEIVAGLEASIARRAAALPPRRRTALARKLREKNDELRVASRQDPIEPALLAALDHEFHATYLKAAAGPRLVALRMAVKPQLERYIRNYQAFLEREMVPALAEHDAIISAIRKGDQAAAEKAVVTNWRNAASRFQRTIEAVGDRGIW